MVLIGSLWCQLVIRAHALEVLASQEADLSYDTLNQALIVAYSSHDEALDAQVIL